jgi:hypothetical protein
LASPANRPGHTSGRTVGALATAYGGITGAAFCKSDTAAFTPPLSPGS